MKFLVFPIASLLLFGGFHGASSQQVDVNKYETDIVLEWNAIGVQANINDHNGPETPGDQLTCTQGPPRAALQLATMHLAVFDAFNSIRPKYKKYLTRVPKAAGGSIIAAVAQAAHTVLHERYPEQRDFINEKLKASLKRALRVGTDRNQSRKRRVEAIKLGRKVGRKSALAILEQRRNDTSCEYNREKYIQSIAAGAHQDDPVRISKQVPTSPDLGYTVKPFVAEYIDGFTGISPPELDSEEYAKAHAQVKDLGANGIDSRTSRTYEGTVVGWFHSYNGSPGLGTPNVLLNEVARVIAKQEKLSPSENARLFALLNVAMANGGIAAWREKFHFNFWRPVVGIRRADEDGNENTVQDATWTPLGAARSNTFIGECNFSPPFPAYTSGHATFCGAGMKTLINFFGTNDLEFDFISAEFNGVTTDDLKRTRPLLTQKFPTLSVFSSQCAASRVFNGVHWSFDGTVGALEGYHLADHLFENALQPLKKKPKAFTAVPRISAEIDGILSGEIPPIFTSPDGHDVEELVTDYLNSPAIREECLHHYR